MRIGVWNTAFLGDSVLTLPLLQSLRRRFPDAVLDFYVRGGLAPLFTPHPDLSSVTAYEKRGTQKGFCAFWDLRSKVARKKYDLWVSAHTSPRSAVMARLTGASRRIGYREPSLLRFAYTDTVPRCFGEMDEIERLLQLLQPLGPGPVEHWPKLALDAKAAEKADAFFSLLSGPALGLHPGSTWRTKRWPAEYYADIGRRALAGGAHVLLFAGPDELDVAREVHTRIVTQEGRRAGERLHDFSGRLSLPELAAWIKRLSCYLTNDSGPMHLAWAQRVPLVALFGPTTRSLGFYPRGEDTTVLDADLACRPCGLHGPQTCPQGHHRCMRDISPEQVWSAVSPRLRPGPAFSSEGE